VLFIDHKLISKKGKSTEDRTQPYGQPVLTVNTSDNRKECIWSGKL